jgi:hypothetical protein
MFDVEKSRKMLAEAEKCVFSGGRYREGGCVFYDKLISDTPRKILTGFQVPSNPNKVQIWLNSFYSFPECRRGFCLTER